LKFYGIIIRFIILTKKIMGVFDALRNSVSAGAETMSGVAGAGYERFISPIVPDFIERRLGLSAGAESISERSSDRRAGIFGEVLESALARVAPDSMELYHVFANLATDPNESWEYENEFEFITGVLGLMPDSIQSGVLSITIAPIMRTIGQDEMADEMLANPDEFINKLRRHEADFGSMYTALRNFGIIGEDEETV
jgi:hypothetical protein